MTNPAEQAAPDPGVDRQQIASGEQFDVSLPVVTAAGEHPATHVARMRGDRMEFLDALDTFVRTGSEASEPIRTPLDTSSLAHVADILNGLGGATVETIDAV
jgi:hypothetical protein